MKKLISKLALFMLVAVGAFVSFTHAQGVKETTLLPGSDFNAVIGALVGGAGNVRSIDKSGSMPGTVTTGEISLDGSEYPVYVWNAGQGHIYYYTEADKIYMNPDSSHMFADMSALEYFDEDWDTSHVTNMSQMFVSTHSLTSLDLSNWDTSNVTNMGAMFYQSSVRTLDLSNWDTSSLTDTNGMFSNCSVETIYATTGFETLGIINSEGMFSNASNIIGGNGTVYDSSKTDKEYARIDEPGFKAGAIPGYFTKKLDFTMLLPGSGLNIKMKQLAGNAGATANTYNTNIQKILRWTGDSMPSGVTKEVISAKSSEYPVYAWFEGGTIYYYAEVDEIYMNSNSSNVFAGLGGLTQLDINWDTSNVTSMYHMFSNCDSLQSINLTSFNTKEVTTMEDMFNNCSSLVSLDLTSFDTKEVTTMEGMFAACTNLETIYVTTGFVTTNVTTSDSMFIGDENLEGGNGTKYNVDITDKIYARIDKAGQPGYFTKKLDYTMLLAGSGFNVKIKKLAGNAGAAYNSQDLNITEIAKWTGDNIPSGVTTEKISVKDSEYPVYAWYKNGTIYYYTEASEIYMNPNSSYMFNNLRRVSSINGGFDTSKVTNMRGMFQNDTSLNSLDLSGWNTSQVTNMQEVFQWCTSLQTLDLSSWNTNNVTTMGRIFDNCTGLNIIYVSDNFVTNNVGDDYQMFTTDTKLVGGNGTKYDSNYVDKTYAKIDKAGQTGYFTDKNSFTVKFINMVNGTETLLTTSKGHQINIPNMNGYTVKGVYSDEAMTQPIDLSNGFDGYTEIYVKYERNGGGNGGGSSGGGGRGGSSSSSDSSNKNNDTTDSDTKGNDKSNTVSSGTNVETDVSKNGKSESTASQAKNNSQKTQISYNDATEELMAAYRFAFRNGITTKSTTENARLYGSLTRIQMAKMLSQFAINVLGQEPDLSKGVANFSDVSRELDKKYDNGVTLAYQLGIMGKNLKNNKFRPYDEVTRAEFATALSRMLYHIEDGTGKVKYYAPHIAKLYEEGILNRVDPKRIEKRGYVMIMLMRSAN